MNENQQRKKELKEIFCYGISGATTAVVNISLYYFLLRLNIDFRLSNVMAIVSSKTYAYFTNKYMVFKSRCSSLQEAFGEFIKFFLTRGFTGVIDFFGVWFLVSILGLDRMISKCTIQIFVIIINYIMGKYFVFIRRE